MFSQELLQSIQDRTSIVELVQLYVALTKRGRSHLGLCPFHSEKTPSFTVSEERGLFYCFGCGVGGSAFTFLMKVEGLEFQDAVRRLAAKAGVAVPSSGSAGRVDEEKKARLLRLSEFAQSKFVAALREPYGENARAYLARRGLDLATIEKFGLGFCPPGGSGLAKRLADRPKAESDAVEIGLLGRRNDGRYYERLWNRVTFAIRDSSGRTIGFGGRALSSEQQPKYLNSPESVLFQKGQGLYGIFEARDAIRSSRRIVIVEGYLDVISLVQAGIQDVVASLGTALTTAQLRVARRLADRIIVFFDGDAAGRRAAMRAFEVCLEADVTAYGAFLPEGFDPDSYVLAKGRAAVESVLAAAIPLDEFFFRECIPHGNSSIEDRRTAAKRVAEVLAKARDPILKAMLARKAAEALQIDEGLLTSSRAPLSVVRERKDPVTPAGDAASLRREEVLLLELALCNSTVAKRVLSPDITESFESVSIREFLGGIRESSVASQATMALLDQLPEEIRSVVTRGVLEHRELSSQDQERMAEDCIVRLGRRAAAKGIRKLRDRLKAAEAQGDDAEARRYVTAFADAVRSNVSSSDPSSRPRKP